MHIVIIITLVLALLFGPQLWVRYVLSRYNKPLDRIPGTGAELAQHLVERFQLDGVKVEQAGNEGDHYDPVSKRVRLSPQNYDTNSLCAVAIAAHEVGHAIQHHRNEPLLALRHKLVHLAHVLQQLAGTMLVIIPVITLLTRAPSAGILMFIVGLGSMLAGTVVQLVTLPVEMDASFNKALPILKEGNYINKKDEKVIEKILRAAALTYLAGSLASLLNLWRWLAVFRKS